MSNSLIEIYDIAAGKDAVDLIKAVLVLGCEVESGLSSAEQGISDILSLVDEFIRKHQQFAIPKENLIK